MKKLESEKPSFLFLKETLSLLSIAAISTLTFPFEMIRTRLQTTPELLRQGTLAYPYTSVKDCVSRIKVNEGIRAFWKGNFANVLRVIPNEAFNYCTKESIQIWVRKHGLVSANNISINFISGSIGAMFTLLFIYPMDFARARLTNDIAGKGSIKQYLVRTYKLEGLPGIYRGSVNFFISSAIFRALYFGIFDTFKKTHPDDIKTRALGSYMGSIVAIYAVYPFDTIRKRMMMTSGETFKYRGFIHCAKHIITYEGASFMYKGWQLSLLQAFGSAGCIFFLDSIGTDLKKKSGI
jgi:solute carrier family 25 (adenine nucleotide translocator) protein 4/5/6/31